MNFNFQGASLGNIFVIAYCINHTHVTPIFFATPISHPFLGLTTSKIPSSGPAYIDIGEGSYQANHQTDYHLYPVLQSHHKT
jgi:hypothetical protein